MKIELILNNQSILLEDVLEVRGTIEISTPNLEHEYNMNEVQKFEVIKEQDNA